MNKRTRFIRIVFLITACRIPVIIGAMHLYVHFIEMVSDRLKPYLTTEVTIAAQKQALWNTWGMTSFMMGICFIILGLLNTLVLSGISKNSSPSFFFLILALCYYLCVGYAGITFNQSFQTYGGFICSTFLITALIVTRLGRPKNAT